MLVLWGFCLVFLCKFFPLITVYHLVAALSHIFPDLVGRDFLSLVHYLWPSGSDFAFGLSGCIWCFILCIGFLFVYPFGDCFFVMKKMTLFVKKKKIVFKKSYSNFFLLVKQNFNQIITFNTLQINTKYFQFNTKRGLQENYDY
jgi:hypothetical protein